MRLRRLKEKFGHLTRGFKTNRRNRKKLYSPSYRFHKRHRERFTYYTGREFRTSQFKRTMVGKHLYEFARTKLTGRAVHRKKRKNKAKAKKKKLSEK